MPYRLRNSKLKQFTHLAGTPPSPFRKKKVTVIGDDDEVITSSDVLKGDDSDFDVDYTGASNLEPVVISNKNISKKDQKEIISEEKSKPKVKNTIGSTEIDDIAEEESYDATMAPLITDMKDSVREATNKAAQVVMDAGLMAAPMPGAGLITKGIGASARGVSRLFRLGKSAPKGVFRPAPTSNLKTVYQSDILDPKDASVFSYFNKKQKAGITNLTNQLSEGASTMRNARMQEIKNLSSPQGFKRLVDQEYNYLTDALKSQGDGKSLQIFKPVFGSKTVVRPTTIKSKDFNQHAISNARNRIAELKLPSVNERLASLKSRKGGKLNFFDFQKAQNILYKRPGGKGTRSADDIGTYWNNAMAETSGIGSKQSTNILGSYKGDFSKTAEISDRFYKSPTKVHLGIGNLKNEGTAAHELAHVLQKGSPSFIDKSLQSSVKSKSPNLLNKLKMRAEENYFRTGGAQRMDPYGRVVGEPRLTEAAAFGREYTQNLQKGGFLKNRYDKITPDIIKKSITSSGGRFSSELNNRIIGLMQNNPQQRKNLAGILNKLPAVGAPVLGGKLLFSGDKN